MIKSEETGAQYITFPSTYTRRTLNSLYRDIPLSDTTARLLRKYFNAAANLYGIISLKKLYQIIVSQCRNPISESEFRAFAEIAKHECEEYFILGDQDLYTDGKKTDLMNYEVIDIPLIADGMDAYITLKDQQRDKPYYIPDRKNFLAYADPFYIEPSEEAAALRNFLRSHTNLSEEILDAVFESICCEARCINNGVPDIMHQFEQIGVIFKNIQDVQNCAEIYQAFHNQARMQCNRGYSPVELRSMQPPESNVPQRIFFGPNIRNAIADGLIPAEELHKQLLTMELPSEALRLSLLKELSDAAAQTAPPKKKVGRNDPCPCGSGKKYKKCCGR